MREGIDVVRTGEMSLVIVDTDTDTNTVVVVVGLGGGWTGLSVFTISLYHVFLKRRESIVF